MNRESCNFPFEVFTDLLRFPVLSSSLNNLNFNTYLDHITCKNETKSSFCCFLLNHLSLL